MTVPRFELTALRQKVSRLPADMYGKGSIFQQVRKLQILHVGFFLVYFRGGKCDNTSQFQPFVDGELGCLRGSKNSDRKKVVG